ncbi:MAG: Hsp20/alpha crystallin family protein [Clostridiales bacterium]|nr:Hsp20/alpha crystallin family protein [Clostridiales bacterium]MDD6540098.1 Hsp20/alpha crystallin family protein [Bacillota bacterium]MDD7015974.1 Hsp20/alpha crystallin family protein [Bacillota bacterium]MDY4959470.1 Hsp20/alpha crystallin family protein [Lentihominibacter sp.]
MLMPSIFGENLFDSFFNDFARVEKTEVPKIMKTDIKENDMGFELDIELPGCSKEDVSAELKDGYLTIAGKTSTSTDEKDDSGRFIRRERYQGSCSRSFFVGEELEQEDIKAKFENGILKVFVPKKEPKPAVETRKMIQIEG